MAAPEIVPHLVKALKDPNAYLEAGPSEFTPLASTEFKSASAIVLRTFLSAKVELSWTWLALITRCTGYVREVGGRFGTVRTGCIQCWRTLGVKHPGQVACRRRLVFHSAPRDSRPSSSSGWNTRGKTYQENEKPIRKTAPHRREVVSVLLLRYAQAASSATVTWLGSQIGYRVRCRGHPVRSVWPSSRWFPFLFQTWSVQERGCGSRGVILFENLW